MPLQYIYRRDSNANVNSRRWHFTKTKIYIIHFQNRLFQETPHRVISFANILMSFVDIVHEKLVGIDVLSQFCAVYMSSFVCIHSTYLYNWWWHGFITGKSFFRLDRLHSVNKCHLYAILQLTRLLHRGSCTIGSDRYRTTDGYTHICRTCLSFWSAKSSDGLDIPVRFASCRRHFPLSLGPS